MFYSKVFSRYAKTTCITKHTLSGVASILTGACDNASAASLDLPGLYSKVRLGKYSVADLGGALGAEAPPSNPKLNYYY